MDGHGGLAGLNASSSRIIGKGSRNPIIFLRNGSSRTILTQYSSLSAGVDSEDYE
jgi:hypothetical protein